MDGATPSLQLNWRSSWHYVLYPSVLLIIILVVLLGPSSMCKYQFRLSFLKCLGRTCLAPFFCVYFCDNMVGDVLTSVAKPLQDIPGTMCYLFSHHPQVEESVKRFIAHGDTCASWQHTYFWPCIAGAPFLFRFMQCGRRFRDTKDVRHLCNLGKYSASLLVVVVAAFTSSPLAIASVSLFATMYAATWDILLDWGINCQALGLSRTESCEFRRLFRPPVYWVCSFLDLIARFSWVLSLLPITVLTDSLVNRALLQMFISVAEIARRSMWAVLRIENEQVSNASKFMAFHWVPMRLGKVESRHQQLVVTCGSMMRDTSNASITA